MTSKRYSLLGWLVWKIAARVTKRKLAANRSKLLAMAVVAAVIAAGIALASGDDE